jgi:CRISPR-associated protein Csx10
MFVVDMECERELSDEELAVLAVSLRSLRHIGTMRTRGKGEVNCSLLLLDKGVYRDITDYYIDKLMEGVKSNA